MTWIYNKQKNEIREEPTTGKPDCWDGETGYLCDKCNAYREYLSALRTLPVSGNHLWEDGKRVEEGKDFEIRHDSDWSIEAPDVAVPLSPVEETKILPVKRWEMDTKLKWVYDRAKELITIINPKERLDYFDNITLNHDGSLSANFSHYSCGDTDNWDLEIAEGDLHMTNEEVNSKYRELEKVEAEKKQKKAEEEGLKKEAEEKKKKDAQEKAEYSNYLRLKEKFEIPSINSKQ